MSQASWQCPLCYRNYAIPPGGWVQCFCYESPPDAKSVRFVTLHESDSVARRKLKEQQERRADDEN